MPRQLMKRHKNSMRYKQIVMFTRRQIPCCYIEVSCLPKTLPRNSLLPIHFARTLQTEFKVCLHQETTWCRTTWRLYYKCQKSATMISSLLAQKTILSDVAMLVYLILMLVMTIDNSSIIIVRIHERIPTPFIVAFSSKP